ncbi:M20 family metallopeptidase [Falsiroseomonas stagni]|uniref:Acetylornithine deacetylase/Succinyl-diaminopimelate desuccinylase n=1 Tax=Falsiroseomonas stagni DSM 19981 TaxID=1123062 RepID=A0A1I3XWZ2_9PROT|nr:M20 family metallopeptidase [Falsiroseomonas stagni]SFK24022.1 Acetylornithine deacetylase/Succinyl-diaminopimelate desuccinylase [Falsiroseomonas stagni DSM 19981]
MSRDAAIAAARAMFDDGSFLAILERRIACPTASQEPGAGPHLLRYLEQEMAPDLERIGFTCTVHPNPTGKGGPFMIARRVEDPALPTLLTYGHGDTVQGLDKEWHEGLAPWTITRRGDRLYGRGIVDNKGQHSANLAALEAVLKTRGRLGFNVTLLLEMSEEVGSPGIDEFARAHRDELKADVLIASDGPRLVPDVPALVLGTRGALALDLRVKYREGGHHSGNWGGLLANPGVRLAHAIASIIDRDGKVLVRDLVPERIPNSVRAALAHCHVDGGEDGPAINHWWGEPGLTAAEKVFGWNTFEVLAFECGHPKAPVNAVPPEAFARCQIRYTVDRHPSTFIPAIRKHLTEAGFDDVQVDAVKQGAEWAATRMDPDGPWPQLVAASVQRTTGKVPMIVPNAGGSLPNDTFAVTLGLPTVYLPHSYTGCSQHAPNEHALRPLMREGMEIMAGVFWDLGEQAWPR